MIIVANIMNDELTSHSQSDRLIRVARMASIVNNNMNIEDNNIANVITLN